MTDTLVVGVAPDDAERHVLARARDDAERWELDGVVAFVVVEPPSFGWLWSTRADAPSDLGALRSVVAAGIDEGTAAGERAPVVVRVVRGAPVARLTELSADAVGLYVGRGPVDALGAVALGCAFSARCPVTLVPRDEAGPERGPVVVGLDDSQCARGAVEHAFEEGVRSGRPVLVVSVVDGLPAATGPGSPTPAGASSGGPWRCAAGRRCTSSSRTEPARRRPEVTGRGARGPAGAVLCDVAGASGASVLVVGARGRGRARRPRDGRRGGRHAGAPARPGGGADPARGPVTVSRPRDDA